MMVVIWGRGEVLVEFIAVEMEVFFHAGDVGIVDVLLVEVFNYYSSSQSSTLSHFRKGGIWLLTLGNTPKRQQKHIQSPDKSPFFQ